MKDVKAKLVGISSWDSFVRMADDTDSEKFLSSCR